jgi:hypothetical protein
MKSRKRRAAILIVAEIKMITIIAITNLHWAHTLCYKYFVEIKLTHCRNSETNNTMTQFCKNKKMSGQVSRR